LPEAISFEPRSHGRVFRQGVVAFLGFGRSDVVDWLPRAEIVEPAGFAGAPKRYTDTCHPEKAARVASLAKAVRVTRCCGIGQRGRSTLELKASSSQQRAGVKPGG